MDSDFEAARVQFVAGVQAFEGGEFERAEALFAESLRLLPGRASTLVNLAAVRLRLGKPGPALAALDEALAKAPDDAQAWYHHGQTLQALQRPGEALRSYDRVLALDPASGTAWSQRGGILKDFGRLAEAAQCFRRALELGADAELNGYFLASVEGAGEPPASAPRAYVSALFDSYAADFDEHLVQQLGYRVPQELVARLPAGRRWRAALDLGCGTGLLGPLLAPRCGAIDGVDLSGGMLEHALALGCYRQLVQAEVAEHLRATPERYELVVATDVFIYIGELRPVFGGVRRVLDGGGCFAFSVEEADAGVRYELRPSSRYAHGEHGLRELAAAEGFTVQGLHRGVLRHEQQQAIGGLLVVLAAA